MLLATIATIDSSGLTRMTDLKRVTDPAKDEKSVAEILSDLVDVLWRDQHSLGTKVVVAVTL